jgi:hypothetical protein
MSQTLGHGDISLLLRQILAPLSCRDGVRKLIVLGLRCG